MLFQSSALWQKNYSHDKSNPGLQIPLSWYAHIFLLHKSKTGNTYSQASPPDSHSHKSSMARSMSTTWPAGAKGLLAPDLLHNRKRQSNWNRSRRKLFKKWIPQKKKKKYFGFARVILKHLIKVLISSKCVQPVQQTSRFHLIKHEFMFGSLWFYLLPLSHPFYIRKRIAEGVQTQLNIPTTTSKKKN